MSGNTGTIPHSLPGPEDITHTSLSNGITILVRANFNSPSIVIGGHLPCGALFNPPQKLGLADFTAAALMRGTHRQTFQQIYNELESNAASLYFGGGTITTGFSGRALSEDLPLLLNLVADVLFQPSFPADEVERLRAQLLTGLAIRAQDTAEMASLTFDQLVFDGHPYALPDDGWPETIQSITRDDLAQFHERCFGPAGMVLAIVGAVEPRQAVDLAEKILGGWKRPGQVPLPGLPPLKPLEKPVRRKVRIPGKAQSDLIVGVQGPTRKSPDYMAAALGNSILGQFGMGGRIGDIVREKSGLAYYASSSLSSGIGPGSWSVSAGVNPKNVERTLDLITTELTRFVMETVTPQELSDSQSNFIGRLPLSLESNGGVMNALLSIERFDLGLDYYQRYPDLVQSVTPEAILETAARYLDPERLVTAIAGP